MEGLLIVYVTIAVVGSASGGLLALLEAPFDQEACRRFTRFALLSLVWPLLIFPLIGFAFGSDDE